MVMTRGEVWWANLPDPVGSMPGYRRPVVIVQASWLTSTGIQTVIVVTVTTNMQLREAPGVVFLPAGTVGLSRDSLINVSQMIAIDKSLLTERVGVLNQKRLKALNHCLRDVLDLHTPDTIMALYEDEW